MRSCRENQAARINIDAASVERYKAELDTARQAYLDSRPEDDDSMEH